MSASQATVLSAMYCETKPSAADSANSAAPIAISHPLGRRRSASRNTDDTAYTVSTSPSHTAKWRMPMSSSSALRHMFSSTARAPLAAARSMNRIMLAPNSSENKPMNFWSTKISPNTPTAQSSQLFDPSALKLKYAASSSLNDTAFISRMPSTATPRIRSRLVMRAVSRTGPASAGGWAADIWAYSNRRMRLSAN